MILLRPSADRGGADHGWLSTRHTFSFADYHDPRWMSFRALRVINEDHIAGGEGFPMHPHRDMEIVTHVLSGRISHRDSMGFESTLTPGDFQRMSAGTGVRHSEFNPDPAVTTHIVQIWIMPDRTGHRPRYDELHPDGDADDLLACSPDGRDGSLAVHQDMTLRKLRLAPGGSRKISLKPGRHAWIQVLRGSGLIDEQPLAEGDGASVSQAEGFILSARTELEALVFDLA